MMRLVICCALMLFSASVFALIAVDIRRQRKWREARALRAAEIVQKLNDQWAVQRVEVWSHDLVTVERDFTRMLHEAGSMN